MDSGQPKPNKPPAGHPGKADVVADTIVRPYQVAGGGLSLPADPFLAPPQQPDEIGRLGHYRVLNELGHGGMGVVYRAEDPRLHRQVALKVLAPGLAADARAKARFVREAQAQAKVEHDHIIPIHSVEESNGVVYIVMPLLKGQTLSAALKQNARLPVPEVVRIGREIAEGLAVAHAAGMAHRNIKPGNIWLEGARRRVKILDFGLAYAEVGPQPHAPRAAVAAAHADTEEATLTLAGTVIGTPAYMSPEQAQAQPTDARSDVFSLGVVLYQMATGVKPFDGINSPATRAAVIAYDPRPAHAVVTDLPPALGELIRRMMAKNPARRPHSANAVAAELAVLQQSLAPGRTSPSSEESDEQDPLADTGYAFAVEEARATRRRATHRRHLPGWAWPVAAAAILLAAGVLTWAVWTSRQADPQLTEDKSKDPAAPVRQKPREARTHEEAVELIVANGGLLYRGNARLTTPAAVRAERANCWLKLASGEFNRALTVSETPKTERGTVEEPFTDADLDAIKLLDVDRFERIYLIGQNVTDAGVGRLLSLPAVRNTPQLAVMYCGIGDETLRNAAKLPDLTFLDLNNTQVTDSGLEYLPGDVKKLARLSLRGTKLTNAAVPGLSRLTSLKELDVRDTGITEAGYRALVAALPKCKIGWEAPKAP